MLIDPAQAARHPAVAEFLIEQQQARIVALEAALQRQFSEPLPPPKPCAPRSPNNPRRWSSALTLSEDTP